MTTTAPLVSPQALLEYFADPRLILLDVRAHLTDLGAGRRAYAEGHLPHAQFLDFEHEVCGAHAAGKGRHPLPVPSDFLHTMWRLGVSHTSRVVVYDAGSLSFAARTWFTLRWLGFEDVSVLDGGFTGWVRNQLPVEVTPSPAMAPGALTEAPSLERVYETSEIEAWVAAPDEEHVLVDARPRARYLGEVVTIDPVAGHIPGSLSLPGEEVIDASGFMKSPQALRSLFAGRLGRHPAAGVIHTCGSGVRACTNRLAMAVAGLPCAGVYIGSFSEWITSPARPVTCGESR